MVLENEGSYGGGRGRESSPGSMTTTGFNVDKGRTDVESGVILELGLDNRRTSDPLKGMGHGPWSRFRSVTYEGMGSEVDHDGETV